MRHALSAVFADVGNDAKTIDATFASQTRCDFHQMPKSFFIGGRRIKRCNFWNDEKMRRRLRHDVVERETQFVFMNNVGGNFAAYDFREDGFGHL